MVKPNAERQKLYSINLSKNKLKFEQMKQKKTRIRDSQRCRNLIGDSSEKLYLR
jgi:hypothetical protein